MKLKHHMKPLPHKPNPCRNFQSAGKVRNLDMPIPGAVGWFPGSSNGNFFDGKGSGTMQEVERCQLHCLQHTLGEVLKREQPVNSIVRLKEFNTREKPQRVTGKNGLSDLNPKGVLLLDFCDSCGPVINIMFKHRIINKCTRTPQT